MEKIIINADDFGLNPSVNKAIVEAFKKGWINSTTLMANMPGFEEAVDLAHENNLQHKIGVHLVLTEGRPLTKGVQSLPFLFDRTALQNKPYLLRRLFLINRSEKQLVFKELSAQIDRLRKKGFLITHLDSHHHIHDVWPVNQIILQLLNDYEIPHMRILNNLDGSNYLHKSLYRRAVNKYLRIKRVNRTDFFGSQLDFLSLPNKRSTSWKNKKIEIMVHPDYNREGRLIDRLNHQEYELDFLK